MSATVSWRPLGDGADLGGDRFAAIIEQCWGQLPVTLEQYDIEKINMMAIAAEGETAQALKKLASALARHRSVIVEVTY